MSRGQSDHRGRFLSVDLAQGEDFTGVYENAADRLCRACPFRLRTDEFGHHRNHSSLQINGVLLLWP